MQDNIFLLGLLFQHNTGEQNKKEDAVWNISPDSTLLGVTDA